MYQLGGVSIGALVDSVRQVVRLDDVVGDEGLDSVLALV